MTRAVSSATFIRPVLSRPLLGIICLVVAVAQPSLAQSGASNLHGTVTDTTGGVVPGVEIIASNIEDGSERTTASDEAGNYSFTQLRPGTYFIITSKEGFSDVMIEGLEVRVNTNTTFPIQLEVGTVVESVTISADAAQLNTTDASIGNSFGTKPIRQLPLNARNPAGLLSLQAGVTFISADPQDAQKVGDIRNGSVNGAQSDQSNVTLDGVDVNDQNGGMPFTSVLRNTLDSIQEFRVVTTTANADLGRSSGAQVSLVTKSGSNETHGSLYEYHRNTQTAANDFFLNSSGVDRAKLIRNVFGASVGSKIVKDRAFYFFNYEGRRDASDDIAVRTVPSESMRNGFVKYRATDGSVQELDPAFIRSNVDPLRMGPNSATLDYFRSFPAPNDASKGDGLNTAGYRFTASTPLVWNTFISKVDWNADKNGAHRMFVRGNYQRDSFSGIPQFPGGAPNQSSLDNSRGLAFGYTGLFGGGIVSTFRYGFTGQRINLSGAKTASDVALGDSVIDTIGGTMTSLNTSLPVQTISQDFSVMRGSHSFQFGGVFRFVRNRRVNYGNSFHFAKQAAWALTNASDLDRSLPIPAANTGVYRETMSTALGLINFIDGNYNFDLSGNALAEGEPAARTFGREEVEFYFQDTWRVRQGVTLTAGVRWSIIPAIREVNGFQVNIRPELDSLIARRLELAEAGSPTRDAGPLGFVAAGDGDSLWPTHNRNFSPRLAVAFSPQSRGGFFGKLFGGPGKTSIRIGGGLFYNNFGMRMIQMLDGNAFGLTSKVTNQSFSIETSPRFEGPTTIPRGGLLPPPPGGPGTPNPFGLAWSQGVDSSLLPPYSINPTASIARDLGGGYLVEVGYVGRLSRRLLTNDTAAAQYTNFKDPQSGAYLIDSLHELETYARGGWPARSVPRIAFWENMYSKAASSGMTATQAVYGVIQANSPDTGTALYSLDSSCSPICSDLGAGTFMNPQFWSFDALRSFGTANYHSMQLSLRKAFSSGFQFDLNYTLSESRDLVSVGARRSIGTRFGQIPGDTYWSTFSVLNSWDREAQRSWSDFDMRHQFNANWVFEVPFGRGKRFLPDMGPAGQAVLGGWQFSGLWRQTSGMPLSILNGPAWPTCYCYQHFAEPTGPIPQQTNSSNARLIGGGTGPNVFSDPASALTSFRQVYPGEIGKRNNLRGDGLFSVDLAIGKRFQLPFEGQSIQFRAEAFNLTNSVTFNADAWNTLSFYFPEGFGNYSQTLVPARVMQFGLRYEF